MYFHFQVIQPQTSHVSHCFSHFAPKLLRFSQNSHLFWVFSSSSSVEIVAKKRILQIQVVPGEPKISKQLKTIATNHTPVVFGHKTSQFPSLCRPSLGSNMFGFTGYWGLMNPRKMFCVASFGNIHLLVCKTILPFMFLGSLGSKKVSFPQGNSDLSSALIAERNVVWWTCVVKLCMAHSDPRNRRF